MSGSDELQAVRTEFELAECGARHVLKRCEESGRITRQHQRDFDYWLGEMDSAARRAAKLKAEEQRQIELEREASTRKRARERAAAEQLNRLEAVSLHEGSHACLFEAAQIPVRALILEETKDGVSGRAIPESGHGPLPGWCNFAAVLDGAARMSDSDHAHAYATAAALVAPGRSVWTATHHPEFDSVQATWNSDATRILKDNRTAVQAVAHALVERRKLTGDSVRRILRRHGAPTSRPN